MLKTVSSITNAIGALNYKGTWNASTNSPALASGVGTKGDYYVVSVAGSTNLDGETLWGVGDWAVFNGAAWQKLEGGATINATTITASGTIITQTSVGVGGATPTNSGAGLTFPATQSASTNANTLDDYEEGTFTPTFSSGVGLPVYTTQLGRYTKIGRVVYFQIDIKLTSGVAAAGQIQFSGLPFTVLNAAPAAAGFIGYSGNFVTAGTTIYLPINNTRVDFYETNGTVLTGLESPAITGDISISGIYTTA
jgi:hypothetical protein